MGTHTGHSLHMGKGSAFARHLTVFAIVAVVFLVIWALTGADSWWPAWALFGWAVGLAAHGIGRVVRRRNA